MSFTGLEKFSHLEDKVRLAVEMCKSLKQDKEALEREIDRLRQGVDAADVEKEELKTEIESLNAYVGKLKAERDSTKIKVEEMLSAIAALEMESESVNR